MNVVEVEEEINGNSFIWFHIGKNMLGWKHSKGERTMIKAFQYKF